MPNLHASRHVVQVSKNFVEAGLISVVAVVSAITAATLIYAWFFT